MKRLLSDYGMIWVLLLLCLYYSVVTWTDQHPTGEAAGRQVGKMIVATCARGSRVLVVTQGNDDERPFAPALKAAVEPAGLKVVDVIQGRPIDIRKALERIAAAGGGLDAIACTSSTGDSEVLKGLDRKFPALGPVKLFAPQSYRWPIFLNAANLRNVANQIVVIAILAIGMTMVIITGGIDLSVGSLIALSAVVATRLIEKQAGAELASPSGMVVCCLAGIGVCAVMGLWSGVMIKLFDIPPFIVTLAMMLVGSGLAFQIAEGQSTYQIPETFVWLGRNTALGGVPISVLVMVGLYAVAHVAMSRMAVGRYIYAVGGNREAARLSGVPVAAVLVFVYTLCGALAGLGGIITASQLKSGSPTYGLMYELYVIAAVVVGGTSLSGGEGKILGTLIGAFIIAVIQNGMNLTGVESYTQKVVLGLVILGAVLLDTLKRKGIVQRWFSRSTATPSKS